MPTFPDSRKAGFSPASELRRLAGRTIALLVLGAGLFVYAEPSAPPARIELAAVSSGTEGPGLREDPARLRAALQCTSDVRTSSKRTVLLVHGTTATPSEDWGKNLAVELPKRGYPTCMVTIPDRALKDMQRNVEYVVSALRRLHQQSGKKVAVIGHSQGAFLISYALRIWPDLASKVSDVVGYAGTYTYGTDFASVLCALSCTEAFQQFRPGSRLLTAVAARPLPAGPAYTAYSTRLDEIVLPQPHASTLRAPGARNYVLQDQCPLDVAEHILLPFSNALLALTLDALSHAGPAKLERVASLRCGLMPSTPQVVPGLLTFVLQGFTKAGLNPAAAEPPLRCYLNPDC